MPSIRIAEMSDVGRISELAEEWGYPVGRGILAKRLGRLLEAPGHTVVVAELESGRVVGWSHGSEVERLGTGMRGEILGLVVEAGYRGQGVGRELVAAVEQWASGRGHREIAVRSNILRAESHPFYQRLGYRRVKTQHSYRKILSA